MRHCLGGEAAGNRGDPVEGRGAAGSDDTAEGGPAGLYFRVGHSKRRGPEGAGHWFERAGLPLAPDRLRSECLFLDRVDPGVCRAVPEAGGALVCPAEDGADGRGQKVVERPGVACCRGLTGGGLWGWGGGGSGYKIAFRAVSVAVPGAGNDEEAEVVAGVCRADTNGQGGVVEARAVVGAGEGGVPGRDGERGQNILGDW